MADEACNPAVIPRNIRKKSAKSLNKCALQLPLYSTLRYIVGSFGHWRALRDVLQLTLDLTKVLTLTPFPGDTLLAY